MKPTHAVSKDSRSSLWYAHMAGYSYIPVAGSFSENKSEAMEYAKMYNGLPHRVGEIERERRGKFYESMGIA